MLQCFLQGWWSPLRWAEGPEATVTCSRLAGVGTWDTGTPCSSAVAWEGEKSSDNPHHELLPKGMRAGTKLPELFPGRVNRSASWETAQNRLFIMKIIITHHTQQG